MTYRHTILTAPLLAVFAAVSLAGPGPGILRLDNDGDGRISREEFRPPEERRGPDIFAEADANDDGAVSRDELLTKIAEVETQRMEWATARFADMDSDGNGEVSMDEARDYAFSRLDADGDGYVTDEEAREMHHRRRGRGEKGSHRRRSNDDA